MHANSPHNLERVSYAECAFFSLMVGMGEAYFSPLSLALGMGEVASALIVTIPVVIASLLQVLWPFGMALVGGAKRWVLLCALAQALLLLLLSLWLAMGANPGAWTFVFACLYWVAHFASGPAWNQWIVTLVEQPRRFHFFSLRSQVHEVAVLAGLVLAGFLLHENKHLNMFAAIFGIAGLFRLASVYCFLLHPAGEAVKIAHRWIISRSSWKLLVSRPQILELLFFLFLFQLSVQIAAPFFTAYMLEHMALDYGAYAVLIAMPYIARSFSYMLAERMAQTRGVDRIWAIGTIFIAPLPILWVLFPHYGVLLAIQVLGGFAWGWNEYGQTLALIRRYPTANRSLVLSLANLIVAAGMGVGFGIGAFLWSIQKDDQSAYEWIMTTSSMMRLLSCLMIPLIVVRSIKARRVFYRILGVRPGGGGVARPILYAVNDSHERGPD